MSDWVKIRKKRLLPITLVSLALPVIVCVTAPVELYSKNAEELAFSLMDFLPFGLVYWLALALLAAAVLVAVPEKLYRLLLPMAAVTAFMLFLQGTYLNVSSTLPGDNMGDKAVSGTAVAVNTALWIGAELLAAGSAFIKKRDAVHMACVLLAVVVLGTQIAGMAFVLLTTDQITVPKSERIQREHPGYEPRVMTCDGLTELGRTNNVLVFIVDRFDETYAEGAYYGEFPEVFDELEGFTWFQDDMSLYAHTFPSVVWMLTDREHSAKMSREEYISSAYEGQTPLKTLHDAGYTVGVYTEDYYGYDDAGLLPEYFANVTDNELYNSIPLKSQAATSARIAQVGLYRCVPLAMKGLFRDVDSGIDYFYLQAVQPENAYTVDMKQVYNWVTGEDFTVTDDKVYHFVHVEGCHNIRYAADWGVPMGQENFDISLSVFNSFQIVDRYLQEMKRLGVYEDATIIITGDHAAALTDTEPLTGPRVTALFVKPSGVGEGELKISQAQVSHEQLWATIFQSEGLDGAEEYGRSVFDVPEGEDQLRTYCWQTYVSGTSKSLDEYTYQVDGLAKAFTNWHLVSQEHYDKFLMD